MGSQTVAAGRGLVAAHRPSPPTPRQLGGLAGLQRTAGNRAVARLVQRTSRSEERFANAEDGHALASPAMAGDQQLEECFDGDRVLKAGASGPSVGKLRAVLAQVGFATSDAVDAYATSTTAAVQAFQRRVGLPASGQDGRVGRTTLGHLDRVATSGGPAQADADAAAHDFEVRDLPAGSAEDHDRVFFRSAEAVPTGAEADKVRQAAAKALLPSGPPGVAPPGPQRITLLGGASEEGSRASNSALARKRMAAVSAQLATAGHPSSLHVLEDRAEEGVGHVDYAHQRSVRMIVGAAAPPRQGACGEKPCDAEQTTAFQAARTAAVTHVTTARARLGKPAAHPHVDRLYGTTAADRPATIAAIDRQMGLVLDQLARIVHESTGPRRTTPGFRCGDPCSCNAVAFNSDCRDDKGTKDLPGEMTLCPQFFTMPEGWRPLLLVHECHHGIAGEHSSDIAYNYTRLLTHLGPADALENANSFHALVRLLDADVYDSVKGEHGIGDVGRPADAHDAVVAGDPALAKAADEGLAVLEQWLTLTPFDTGEGHEEIREARKAGRPLQGANIQILSSHFPISKVGQRATEQDQRRVAAIYDRVSRLHHATDQRLSIGVGPGVTWSPGPGTDVRVPRTFAATAPRGRTTALLHALVHATPDVSAALEPAYVGAVAAMAEARGLVGT